MSVYKEKPISANDLIVCFANVTKSHFAPGMCMFWNKWTFLFPPLSSSIHFDSRHSAASVYDVNFSAYTQAFVENTSMIRLNPSLHNATTNECVG